MTTEALTADILAHNAKWDFILVYLPPDWNTYPQHIRDRVIPVLRAAARLAGKQGWVVEMPPGFDYAEIESSLRRATGVRGKGQIPAHPNLTSSKPDFVLKQ